jgi:hypothetical protein
MIDVILFPPNDPSEEFSNVTGVQINGYQWNLNVLLGRARRKGTQVSDQCPLHRQGRNCGIVTLAVENATRQEYAAVL